MQSQAGNSFYNRYKILQPNLQNVAFRSCMPFSSTQTYQLIKFSGKSIRKYHQYCQDMAEFLPLAQWRFEACKEVAHYLYVKLNKPEPIDSGIQIQIFVEHMELLFKDIKKLITSQALYLLSGCLRGYSQLLQKFKKVSVNSQTIGLNSEGKVMVWLNRHMQRNYCQYYSTNDQAEVIKGLINLLKQKGEVTCQSLLNKILDYAEKYKSSIKEILSYIDKFAQYNFIKPPQHLKYLLKQSRIIQELEQIQGEKTTRIKQRKYSTQYAINLTSRSNLGKSSKTVALLAKDSSIFSKYLQDSRKSNKRFSLMQQRLKSSKILERSDRFLKLQVTSQQKGSVDRLFGSYSQRVHSKQSQSISRSDKTEKSIRMFNQIKSWQSRKGLHINSFQNESSLKIQNKIKTSQAKTSSSYIELQKNMISKPLIRKADKANIPTHNSILSQLSNSAEQQVVPEEQQQQESQQSSPEKGNLMGLNNSKKSDNPKELQLSFGLNADNKLNKVIKNNSCGNHEKTQTHGIDIIDGDFAPQIIFKGNNWTKTLNGLLEHHQTDLNTSYVEGSEKCIYLEDVKLDKLDELNKRLTESLVPYAELIRKESAKK